MQIVLNCEDVSQQVKLRPHFDSIKSRDQIKLRTYTTSLLNKQIGPVLAFIYNINDSEIYAKEISIDFNINKI